MKKKNSNLHINLLVTIDKNYLNPLIMMLKSYNKFHPDVTTDVYIVHSNIEKKEINKINNILNNKNINIKNIMITNDWFDETPVLERLPKESFYRLLAFDYLPKNVDKCLYLDPDIIIRKSLVPLYEMDIENNYIAAASHLHGFLNNLNKVRLELENQERYVNSGIMLMNLKEIRKDFTKESIFECVDNNIQKLIMGDQDLVNILFDGKTILIDECIYNLDEKIYKRNKKNFDINAVKNQTAIIHYNGKYKPWLNGYKGELNQFYPTVKNKGPAPTGKLKQQIKAILNITKPSKRQLIAISGILLFILLWIALFLGFREEIINLISNPNLFKQWLSKFGGFDELVFLLIRTLQTIIKVIPAEPIEIASGYAWGNILGTLYCLIGNLIGSIIILFISKKYSNKVINFFLPTKNIKSFNISNKNNIYMILFILYLIPGTPKDSFTYLVGLTDIKIVPFLIITGIARIPSIISSTLVGSTLASQKYWLSFSIFIITIFISIIGMFLYKKIIKRTNKLKKIEP